MTIEELAFMIILAVVYVAFTLACVCSIICGTRLSCVKISRNWRFRKFMHRYFGWEYISFKVDYGDGRRTERLKHNKHGKAYVRYRNRAGHVYKGYVIADLRHVRLELGKL